MRTKLKLLLLTLLFASGGSRVLAQTVDCTDKVSTAATAWHGSNPPNHDMFVTTKKEESVEIVEFYEGKIDNTQAGRKLYQTVTGLAAGVYEVEVYATAHAANGIGTLSADADDVAYVYATATGYTNKTPITARKNNGLVDEEKTKTYKIENVVVLDDGELTIGLQTAKAMLTNWYTIQIYSLTKVGSEQQTYDILVAKAKELLQTKISDKTKGYLKDYIEFIEKEENVDDNARALAELIAEVEESSAALIDDATILWQNADGWEATTIGSVKCNTWSTEGNTDGSGMITPFIENWTDKANGGLGEGGELYYTLKGLNPGDKYSVTALVRVYNENNTGVDGAYFFVGNDDDERETKSLDDYGALCINKPGKYATLTCSGVVDREGNLKFGVALSGENCAINWIAIKNIVIAEYKDVLPAEIMLNTTSATVTTGGTYTLIAEVFPSDALDKSLTWESDDPTVATVSGGVVYAQKAGTAQITATAVAGKNVTATATITVENAKAPSVVSEIEDGIDFYIVNAATGRYLGGANSWGTQASLIEHGIPFTAAKINNGQYTLDSHTYNGNATSHFLGVNNGLFVDCDKQTLYIAPLDGGNGQYLISTADGQNYITAQAGSDVVVNTATDYTNPLAQWYFISKADREKTICEAENGGDATFYLAEANISRNLRKSYGVSGWTGVFEYSAQVNKGAYEAATRENQVAQTWHQVTNVYQTILVPNGEYEVTCQGFCTQAQSYLYANDEKQLLAAFNANNEGTADNIGAASEAFTKGLYVNTLKVTVTNNMLTVGIKTDSNNDWTVWDNFSLKLLSNGSVEATEDTKEDVIAAMQLGFDAGEHAPYENVEVINKANAYIALIDESLPYSYNKSAIENLEWKANVAEVNAVYDGTFANAENNGAPLGWKMSDNTLGGEKHARAFVGNDNLSEFNDTKSGFFIRFDGDNSTQGSQYIYGGTEAYTMPLKAETYYTVSLDFKNWNTAGSNPLSLSVKGPGYTTTSKTEYSSNQADKDDVEPNTISYTFKTADAGDYTITLWSPGDVNRMNVVSNIVLKRTVVTIDEDADYEASDITADVVLKRTIKEGMNTLVLPFNLTQEEVEDAFGEGSIVYVVESYANDNITFDTQDGIEANVPCLLYVAEESTKKSYKFANRTLVNAEPTVTKGDVTFTGTYKPIILDDTYTNTYIVNSDKLYLVNSNVTMKATRAYFQIDESNGVKVISMSFGDDATGIVTVDGSEVLDGKIYDLQGREVKNPARGIYIIGGKKVLVK